MPKPRCRTGCLTCRIRRIKCDEIQPACKRCSSTGRKCDGYEELQSAMAANSKKSVRTLAPNRVEVVRCSLKSLNSPAEQRGLHYFRESTAVALAGYFDCDFWTSMLLQVGSSKPAVLHAIVALSSLHEGLQVGGDICPGNGKNYLLRRLAIQQYDKAIGMMLPRMAIPQPWSSEDSLIACLLFVLIEITQSNYNIAAEQLKIGIRNVSVLAARAFSEPSLGFNSNIHRLFGRLFIQSMFLAEPMLEDFIPPMPSRVLSHPFRTIDEARESLDIIFLDLYPLLFAIGHDNQTPNSQLPAATLLTTCLQEWTSQFQLFLASNENVLTTKQSTATSILTIHSISLAIMLASTTTSSLTPPIKCISAFSRILFLSNALLSNSHQILLNFTFDHGIIGPLFYIVLKCPVRSLRLQAVELLDHPRIPKREGMWCGPMTAKMAKRIFEVSEELRSQAADVDSLTRLESVPTQGKLEEGTKLSAQKVAIWFDKPVGDEREITLMVGARHDGPYMREVVVSW